IAVTVGWRWAVAVAIVPFVAVMALLFAGRLPRRGGRGRAAPPEPAGQAVTTDQGTSRSGPVPRGILLLAVGAALGSTAATGISVFLTQSAVASGLTTSQGGVLLAIASIVGVATRIGTGIF